METNEVPRRRGRSPAGPVILISLGLLFLLFNFVPDFDPWPVLARFWPLILILAGLGRLWDYYQARQHPEAPRPAVSGVAVAWILLFVLLVAASWHGRTRFGHGGHGQFSGGSGQSSTETVDLGAAKSVSASMQIPSGTLEISGAGSGGLHLLDATFHYQKATEKPRLDYEVSGDHGQLNITQGSGTNHTHVVGIDSDDSEWDVQLGEGIPLDLKIEMGAGESDLRLNGIDVTNLDLELGAGELNLDVTGDRKDSMNATIEGGAGTATIRLPKNVGVRVKASGGIGSITAEGLKHDGDVYTNDAYGKTAATIDMDVEGGVGAIRLETD